MEGTCIRRAGALATVVPPGLVFVKAWRRGPAPQHGSLGDGMGEDRGPSAVHVQQGERAAAVVVVVVGGVAAGVCRRAGGGGLLQRDLFGQGLFSK